MLREVLTSFQMPIAVKRMVIDQKTMRMVAAQRSENWFQRWRTALP